MTDKQSLENVASKRSRATKNQMAERHKMVFGMLGMGFNEDDIRAQLAQQGLKPKSIQRTIRAAKEMLIALAQEDSMFHQGKLFRWIDQLFQTSMIGPDKNPEMALKAATLLEKAIHHYARGTHHEPSNQASNASSPPTDNPGRSALTARLAELARNH